MSTEELTCAKKKSANASARPQQFVRPRYSIVSEEDKHVLKASVPGATKEGVSITRDGEILLISANRVPHFDEKWKAVGQEIQNADYRLKLKLNVAVNDEAISAKLENGVLEVALPVAEAAKPRQIAID